MELTILKNGLLQIDNARIIFRNFSGRPSKFNKEGDRNFSLVIPSEEIADVLVNNVNDMGIGWNVRIKDAIEEGELPFMHMKVKVKFNDKGPNVYLVSGSNRTKLDEESISILDNIDISSVDLDIRPYDGEVNGKPFRSAYLQSMELVQEIDRFAAMFVENEPRE